jgi:hypothetical protein
MALLRTPELAGAVAMVAVPELLPPSEGNDTVGCCRGAEAQELKNPTINKIERPLRIRFIISP